MFIISAKPNVPPQEGLAIMAAGVLLPLSLFLLAPPS